MPEITQFRLQAQDFRYVGTSLSRPECIIAEPDGTLWISDDRSALTRIDPTGAQSRLGSIGGVPNGIAMAGDGSFFIANIGDGKLYRLRRDGTHEVVLDQFEGHPLGSVNFVYIDQRDRLWVSVSTLTEPRSEAVHKLIPDGYVVLMDKQGSRKVADRLYFANEVRIDAAERYLYIAETAAGRISRQPLKQDGSLGARESFGPDPLFAGAKVDGITFDAAGNLWITEITRNALIVLTPSGQAHTVFEDPDGKSLFFPTSLTFGGADLKTAYVGSLKMDLLAAFASPVAGAPMSHWMR